MAIKRERMVLLWVETMVSFGEYIWEKYAPKFSPKMGVNRQFSAKTANIKIAISQKL